MDERRRSRRQNAAAMALALLHTLLLTLASPAPTRRVLLYVDPSNPTEGAESPTVLSAAANLGVECIQLWSAPTAAALCRGAEARTAVRVEEMGAPAIGDEASWASRTLGAHVCIEGVLCGSDGGLATAERLQHMLVPERSNGINRARRDKFLMQGALSAAGLDVASQVAPTSWAEAETFLRTLAHPTDGSLRAVLKPRRGQASVGVHLVRSLQEARAVYDGLSRCAVSSDESEVGARCLVMEALEGREWVVDTVLALWRYDKGSSNGAPFVYFGAEPRGCDTAETRTLAEYALRALDALGWRWGAAHLEIMATPQGPRLVEANVGRWNGLDFKLLADVCFGGNAFEATVHAYLDADAWAAIPTAPGAAHCSGMLAVLCASVEGTYVGMRHADALTQLSSLVAIEPAVAEGEPMRLTTDLDSAAGYAQLMHQDPAVVAAEYEELRRLQPSLFVVAEEK